MSFNPSQAQTGGLTKEALLEQISPFLDEVPEDDDNLMDFGLTSIAAMQLVAQWRNAGFDLSFVEMAENLTLSSLFALLQEKSAAKAA